MITMLCYQILASNMDMSWFVIIVINLLFSMIDSLLLT